MKRLIALAILAACDHRAPIESCHQDLGGTYVSAGQRWMLLDNGATLEAYPLFPDVPVTSAPGSLGIEVAPRVIDLVRDDDGISGVVRRRYLRAAASCEAAIPARITVCADDALDILIADPVPPIQFDGPLTIGGNPAGVPVGGRSPGTIDLFGIHFTRTRCTFPRPDSNRRERWHRE